MSDKLSPCFLVLIIALVLILALNGSAYAQPRGGAGGIGAASGGFGGPGVGVSGGGAPAISGSWGPISHVHSWAATAAPQSADPNAQLSYTARPAPVHGYVAAASVRRRAAVPFSAILPDIRPRTSLSRRDDLYLGLTHSVLGNPHGDSRRPRKHVGQSTIGAQLGPDADAQSHGPSADRAPRSILPRQAMPTPDQGTMIERQRHRRMSSTALRGRPGTRTAATARRGA